MTGAVEKSEDRNVEELLERFKESTKDVVEGRMSKVEDVKEQVEGKKQDN